MKNVATLVMLTFLAVTGYYVGVAVAMNNDSVSGVNEPSGVMVVEEEYGIVATPDTHDVKSVTENHKNNHANVEKQKHNMKNNHSNDETMVVEEVDETETVE